LVKIRANGVELLVTNRELFVFLKYDGELKMRETYLIKQNKRD